MENILLCKESQDPKILRSPALVKDEAADTLYATEKACDKTKANNTSILGHIINLLQV